MDDHDLSLLWLSSSSSLSYLLSVWISDKTKNRNQLSIYVVRRVLLYWVSSWWANRVSWLSNLYHTCSSCNTLMSYRRRKARCEHCAWRTSVPHSEYACGGLCVERFWKSYLFCDASLFDKIRIRQAHERSNEWTLCNQPPLGVYTTEFTSFHNEYLVSRSKKADTSALKTSLFVGIWLKNEMWARLKQEMDFKIGLVAQHSQI